MIGPLRTLLNLPSFLVAPRCGINVTAAAKAAFRTDYLIIKVAYPPSQLLPRVEMMGYGDDVVLANGVIALSDTDPLLKRRAGKTCPVWEVVMVNIVPGTVGVKGTVVGSARSTAGGYFDDIVLRVRQARSTAGEPSINAEHTKPVHAERPAVVADALPAARAPTCSAGKVTTVVTPPH